MMGKPFDDATLVAMAYAFEQSVGGVRRRPPLTTPVLRNGRAPAAQTYRARAGATDVTFRFDALRNELHYTVAIPPASTRTSQAVVLRRTDAAIGAGAPRVRVIQRLVGPGLSSAIGMISLGELDRRALGDGRLGVLHVTSESPLGRVGLVERAVRR
jgi:hypothetical protein